MTEGTSPSPNGLGYCRIPGIYNEQQVKGWKLVTDAVHAKGGVFYLQLWHTGRVSHSSHQPDGAAPVGPSAIRAEGGTINAAFQPVPYEVPRALEIQEIAPLVDTFRQAAANAIAAGFDGVEIHGANGYLLEQFLYTRTNTRTDAYGGSIENRSRLHLEVTDAVIREIGAARTGIRLSPWGIANDCAEADPVPLFTYLIGELAKRNLVYLHLIEPRASGTGKADIFRDDQPSAAGTFRAMWPTVLIDAGGFTAETAPEAVSSGRTDAVAFGRFFISNPDLVARIRQGTPFTPYHRPTFYGGGAEGYTDYPAAAD